MLILIITLITVNVDILWHYNEAQLMLNVHLLYLLCKIYTWLIPHLYKINGMWNKWNEVAVTCMCINVVCGTYLMWEIISHWFNMEKCWLQVIIMVLLFLCVCVCVCVCEEITYPQFMAYVITNSLSPFTVMTNANVLCQKEYVCKTVKCTQWLKRMKNTPDCMIPDICMEVKTQSVVFWGYNTRQLVGWYQHCDRMYWAPSSLGQSWTLIPTYQTSHVMTQKTTGLCCLNDSLWTLYSTYHNKIILKIQLVDTVSWSRAVLFSVTCAQLVVFIVFPVSLLTGLIFSIQSY